MSCSLQSKIDFPLVILAWPFGHVRASEDHSQWLRGLTYSCILLPLTLLTAGFVPNRVTWSNLSRYFILMGQMYCFRLIWSKVIYKKRLLIISYMKESMYKPQKANTFCWVRSWACIDERNSRVCNNQCPKWPQVFYQNQLSGSDSFKYTLWKCTLLHHCFIPINNDSILAEFRQSLL